MTDLIHRYVIGIDLGTTNSAVAYVDLAEDATGKRRIRHFGVPQLVGLGEVAPRSVLPSFRFCFLSILIPFSLCKPQVDP